MISVGSGFLFVWKLVSPAMIYVFLTLTYSDCSAVDQQNPSRGKDPQRSSAHTSTPPAANVHIPIKHKDKSKYFDLCHITT